MSITHLVLFQFKAGTARSHISDTCQRMLELQQTCLHAESQTPYILSMSGGKDNSPEGHQNGHTHAFVVQFSSREDRNYYVHKDPAHLSFIQSLSSIVEKVTVVDFTPGDY